MSTFTAKEIEYLSAQPLGRLATVGRDGAPHVVPVGFRLSPDGDAIDIGGHGFGASKKWRDMQADPRVSFVVDDLESVDPWTPRAVSITGRAELHETGGTERFGKSWDEAWIRIVPTRVGGWGVEGPAFSPEGRRSFRTVGA
ncbi:PPOX class F420-dependent oxidoreductase [Labedaea rhizosphaerae]|uniref:Pyridoxamine 5'-phosphate oxidase family protein n=1 Tax=Labedaea rhizosphaerae TaxID=598644 RepID=A0A4R6SCM3_LABRH|nr:PPOX class F420-dependent oxidoreductase [Labedaea rhizosphaerae]TDP97701.1 pyridoxamine 5'-phosphate oxidase family protein [Labedaea rhizosphaerae]